LLAALLADHAWPAREDNRLLLWLQRCAMALEGAVNGGQYQHGLLGWVLVVGPALAVTVAVQLLAEDVSWLAAAAWNVAVLYCTMGFRRLRRSFVDVERALREGDLASARDGLGKWRRAGAAELTAGEAARVAIEHGLLAAHRRVFGPVAWFVVLGPAGAVLYRLSALLSEWWDARSAPDLGAFGAFAARAFFWIDWLPSRLTAAGFAAAGDFADAVYCWRAQAATWTPRADGVILASGGGALGVRLGDALHQDGGLHFRPELGTGNAADVDDLQQAMGLIWRALVLWLFLVFLVNLAHALG
jgi:adenosylcobinamide-phosphate synthase